MYYYHYPKGSVVSCCRISFDTYTLGGGVNIKGYNPSYLYQGTIYSIPLLPNIYYLLVNTTGFNWSVTQATMVAMVWW